MVSASQGPYFPSTCVNSPAVGGTDWTTPENAEVEDAVVARETSATSNFDQCTGYNFSIPANATITGILVGFKRDADAGKLVTDNSVRIIKANSAVGTDKAVFTDWTAGTLTWDYYGGSSDLWGTTWSPSEINDSGFGSALSGVKDSGGSQPFNLDAESITVYYMTQSGGSIGAQ